jgi:hypothetical protein
MPGDRPTRHRSPPKPNRQLLLPFLQNEPSDPAGPMKPILPKVSTMVDTQRQAREAAQAARSENVAKS